MSIQIQYRYPRDDWDTQSTITEDELFDGSTFDYYAICVVDQHSHDYISALELMRGERVYDLHLTPDEVWHGGPTIFIRVVGL